MDRICLTIPAIALTAAALLIGLRLDRVIDWHWAVVLLPLWLLFLLCLLVPCMYWCGSCCCRAWLQQQSAMGE
jgi:hypothetical protein